MNKLVLIDGNSLIYRAFYGSSPNLENILRSSDGTPTNALTTFIRMIEPIIWDQKNVLIAFDSRGATFRHNAFKEYKGTRSQTPTELLVQKPLILKYLNKRGVPHYFKEGFEADDVVAAMCDLATKKGYQVEVFSSDRDLLQLVSDNVTVSLIKRGMRNIVKYTSKTFVDLVGVEIDQFLDYKALVGDSSDNIKGVNGVGPKTATKLLKEYKTLDGIYENIDKLTPKAKENFLEFKPRKDLVHLLVSLRSNIGMDIGLDFTKMKDYQESDVYSFLRNYQITSFRVMTNKKKTDQRPDIDIKEQLDENDFSYSDKIAICIVITSTSLWKSNLKGLVGISDGNKHVVLNIKEFLLNKKLLEATIKNKKVVTNNGKAIWRKILDLNIEKSNIDITDLNLVDYLLNPSRFQNVKKLLANYESVGYEDPSLIFKKLRNKNSEEFEDEHKKGCAETAMFLFEVSKEILKRLEKESVTKNYFEKFEKPLTPVLAQMENNGIGVDKKFLLKQKEVYEKECDSLRRAIYDCSGEEYGSFNVESPAQLAKILFDKLQLPRIKKNTTDINVLQQLIDRHPIVPLVINFRKKRKILSTYTLPFLEKAEDDGRVHPQFHQIKVVTGRISTSNPSIQNLTSRNEEQRVFKKALTVLDDDSIFIAADYSQVELRILAHLAKEENLIEYFKKSIDVHKATASRIFNVDIDKVTPKQRSAAKTVNFGVIYGMGPFMLSKQLDTSVKKAKEFIADYFELFPNIRKYKEETISFCNKHKYVETILKRRRYLYDIDSSSNMIRSAAEREAVNMRIQGSQSEILKIAMLEIQRKYKNNNLRMVGQIHDELIFETSKNQDLEIVKKEIETIMMSSIKLLVPLKVNISQGFNWFML